CLAGIAIATVRSLAGREGAGKVESQETCPHSNHNRSFRVKGDERTGIRFLLISSKKLIVFNLKLKNAMRARIITIISVFLAVTVTRAQDSLTTILLKELVTTGTRFDVPVEKSGKTIYKLTTEDLQRNAGKSVADILNEVPGVQTDGNFGTRGTNIDYSVRGGRNKHTLVLIDGVPLNDPSGINAGYDLRYLPVSQIESIEVLKGGLSTLYGTGAAAGVINIK